MISFRSGLGSQIPFILTSPVQKYCVELEPHPSTPLPPAIPPPHPISSPKHPDSSLKRAPYILPTQNPIQYPHLNDIRNFVVYVTIACCGSALFVPFGEISELGLMGRCSIGVVVGEIWGRGHAGFGVDNSTRRVTRFRPFVASFISKLKCNKDSKPIKK